jgi:hypothetical protein
MCDFAALSIVFLIFLFTFALSIMFLLFLFTFVDVHCTVVSRLSTQLEPTRFVRTLDLPLPNHLCFATMLKKLNGKHLNEHQRCKIISKLSKTNVPSKRALAREYSVSEGAIRKVWDNPRGDLGTVCLTV